MRFAGLSIGRGFAGLAMVAALAACSQGEESDAPAAAAEAPADIAISGSEIFPESITSDAAGNIYIGSNDGTIYRAAAGTTEAVPFIKADDANGIVSLFGVFADDAQGRLWACSIPNLFRGQAPDAGSALKAFDLATGKFIASYDLPSGAPAACNDIAVAEDSTVYASETSGGRIFTLAPGADALTLFAEGEDLVGIDGIAFAGDGTLYINNVRKNLLQRVNRAQDGSYAGLTDLALDVPLNGPDALRALGGNRFIQAEGPEGRVALIDVEGDGGKVTVLKTGLDSAPAVTVVGDTAYAPESKIGYLMDPAKKGQDPGPFVIRAFPISGAAGGSGQ